MSEWHTRFKKHFIEGGLDDCWPWISGKSDCGYGRFWLAGKSRIASRLAFIMANGPIPDEKQVLHQCDNPACVNPCHLFLGTHIDNMRDRNTKQRARGGSLRGSKHPMAKLNDEQRTAVRHLASCGNLSQRIIAKQFGISQSQVSIIRHSNE